MSANPHEDYNTDRLPLGNNLIPLQDMKKKPHPLVAVRKAIGRTQPEFAKDLGVSASAVQHWETDALTLTEERAKEIMALTGVLYVSLLKGSTEAVDIWGVPYTRDSFNAFRSQRGHFVPEHIRKLAEQLGKQAGFDAGVKITSPDEVNNLSSQHAANRIMALQTAAGSKLLAIQVLIDNFIAETLYQYSLEGDFLKAIKALGLPEKTANRTVEFEFIDASTTRITRRVPNGELIVDISPRRN